MAAHARRPGQGLRPPRKITELSVPRAASTPLAFDHHWAMALRNGVGGLVAMTAKLEFCLLGPLVVRCEGTILAMPRGKQRTLLAALLLSPGRTVPVDELAELLWASGPPPSARVTVQNYVMRLRKALGETARTRIDTRPGGYRINLGGTDLDVSRLATMLASAQTSARAGRWEEAASSAAALSLLGEALLVVGQPSRARTRHTTACDIASDIGDKYQQARAHDGLARAHHALARPGQARDHWAEALALYTHLGTREADQVRAQLARRHPR